MLKPQDKEISGIVFRYQPMMATPARKLLDDLIKRFGPAIGDALAGVENVSVGEGGDIWSSVAKAIGSGFSGLAGALDPNFHEQLVKDLGNLTRYKNDEGNFVPLKHDDREMMFGTKLATESQWILFCLEVQFGDFLDLFRDGLSGLGALKLTVE